MIREMKINLEHDYMDERLCGVNDMTLKNGHAIRITC